MVCLLAMVGHSTSKDRQADSLWQPWPGLEGMTAPAVFPLPPCCNIDIVMRKRRDYEKSK
jgi:hypothetical protein